MKEKVQISKPNKKELDKLGIKSWDIWEKEVSKFPYEYHEKEIFFVFEGKASVELDDGKIVQFGKGDLVQFAQGVKCNWTIQEKIRKAYKFGD